MNPALAILLLAVLLPAPTSKEHRLRLAYDDVTAHAEALIETVDSIEADLNQQGLTLNPEIASARDHLGAALDSASDALSREDWKQLEKHLDHARGWMEKLRRRL